MTQSDRPTTKQLAARLNAEHYLPSDRPVTEEDLREWELRHGDGAPSLADQRILRLIAAVREARGQSRG
jgi:hypothetical protein